MIGIRDALRVLTSQLRGSAGITKIQYDLNYLFELLVSDYLQKHLHGNPRYQDPKRLNAFERQVYSQGGEDGIIAEIFRRIGTTDRFFVEFGAGDGLQSNTACLLLKRWTGLWIEPDSGNVQAIRRKFVAPLSRGRLALRQAFITADNIEALFREGGVPAELDFLSIDIDGNDYWVWKSLVHFRPRVVAIEYNAVFPPDLPWVMKYDAGHRWFGGSYFGASLKALEDLGREKGYGLVGCSFAGFNAFFVRNDLLGDKFAEPWTAENHYESARYFLTSIVGHRRDFGEMADLD